MLGGERRAAVLLIGVLAVAFASCGIPSKPESLSSTTSTSTSTSNSTTAPTPAFAPATLSVVHCTTSFAVTPSPTTWPIPASVTVSVPVGGAAGLAVYSDESGIMMLDRARATGRAMRCTERTAAGAC